MSEHEIPIKVDKNEYKVPDELNPVTGEYLRSRIGLDDKYDLWLRGRGQEDDVLIRPGDKITLEEGMHFYTAKSVITPGGLSC